MFIYTRHSFEKIDALGIEKGDVEQTIKKGMKWKEEKSEKWHARMAAIEVVFMKRNKDFIIITAYFVRG